MVSIKGHFDGRAVVLDEPAVLAIGQTVRVIAEASGGVVAGQMIDGGAPDERTAVKENSAEGVPATLVRKPGSAAGMIHLSADFAQTPDEFKDYL